MSAPAAYVAHRDSQVGAEDVGVYLNTVHGLVNEAAASRKQAYFGRDLSGPLRPWSAEEVEAEFNPELARAAVSTPEVAIDPIALAQSLREAIAAQPRIETRCLSDAVGLREDKNGVSVLSQHQDGAHWASFDHVVNAACRLALDERLGFRADRPFMHRLKYGVSLRLPPGAPPPPSATFVLGPFGEVVAYGDGLVYLTWYPECLRAISTRSAL